jgi:hypothetical protein
MTIKCCVSSRRSGRSKATKVRSGSLRRGARWVLNASKLDI